MNLRLRTSKCASFRGICAPRTHPTNIHQVFKFFTKGAIQKFSVNCYDFPNHNEYVFKISRHFQRISFHFIQPQAHFAVRSL